MPSKEVTVLYYRTRIRFEGNLIWDICDVIECSNFLDLWPWAWASASSIIRRLIEMVPTSWSGWETLVKSCVKYHDSAWWRRGTQQVLVVLLLLRILLLFSLWFLLLLLLLLGAEKEVFTRSRGILYFDCLVNSVNQHGLQPIYIHCLKSKFYFCGRL